MRSARVSAVVALALIATSCSGLLAQDAPALEPGVHVDPGSPAAKEYALPVNQARGTGGGTGGGGASEGSGEKLFGAGIKPPSSDSSPPASGATPNRRHPKSSARGSAGSPGSAGTSSLLVLLAGGVGVLALGGFAGIVLRHTRRPTSAR